MDKEVVLIMEVLKVSAKSNPNSVAGALAGVIRENGSAEMQAIGAGALNQAVKAVAIARGFVAPHGVDLICIPAFTDIKIDGEERTAIKLIVEPRLAHRSGDIQAIQVRFRSEIRMPSDLHMHTTYSDGKLTPEELVAKAKEAGLSYMAITDHDTVEGISHLYENGLYPARGIHIIPGIEFSAHHPTREIHILGYNIDIYYGELVDKLNDVTEARWTRFSEMVEKLQHLGYEISETEVLTIAGASRSISRSHIGRVLVKKGYFPTVRDAFEAMLMKGKPAYVPHYHLEVEDIIGLIKAAGGTPVLAHPKLIGDDRIVEDLCCRGIEGLEVFYPQHDAEDTARYLEMAKRYNLLVTGGSDFHGFATRYPQALGVFTIDDCWAEKLYRPTQKL